MAKRPSEAALRAAKEAKQKKLLLLLAPVLIALMAWQGPKTLKAFRGSSPPPPAAPATPTPAPSSTTTTGTPSSADAGGLLPDTDSRPGLLDGQLLSFSRFSGRDPFVPVGAATDSSGPAAEDAATIEVNGTSENLAVGDSFPASDPTFKLVSVSSQSATIGLVSGSFSNGDGTIVINVGETLVLVADDGARYAIKLISVAAA